MKLSERTISILKSFTAINPSLVVRKGNVVKTMAPTKTILATAELDQEFPVDFAIYDLPRLINGFVSLHKDPDIKFQSDNLEISSENSKSRVFFSDPDILTDPYKEIKLPSVDVAFRLSKDNLEKVKKAAAVWGVDDIVVIGDGHNITLKAVDVVNPTTSSYEVEVGETNKKFQAVFKVENFNKPLSTDYDVEISSRGFAHWKGEGIEYYVALEADASKF